ncbi:MAG: response regulator [Myxococcota bacterium]
MNMPAAVVKKRILFVDDEPMILAGLQNTLRPLRREWDTVFVDSGAAALDQLAAAPFDVIVSDMRMPRMDGATLLQQVHQRHPQVVRIVLSGYTEMEAALRAVPIAHQFLTKPCEPTLLRSVIERACSLQKLMGDVAVRDIVGSVRSLPSTPRVYLALTRALENPNTSVRELAGIVETDVAMSAKILQLVNSAFFGLARRFTSIQEAVAYLGTNMMKSLTLSVETFQSFPELRVKGFDPDGLQRHSVLTARIARQMFKDKRQAEDAFTAAMLHDVGKLIAVTHYPERFCKALDAAREQARPLVDVEYETAGASHAEAGAYLLGIWGLPYPVVEAVAHHHHPQAVPHTGFDLVDAVYVADVLAEEAAGGGPPETACNGHPLDEVHLARLGMLNQLSAWRELAARAAQKEA